jgi:hypothetical protein
VVGARLVDGLVLEPVVEPVVVPIVVPVDGPLLEPVVEPVVVPIVLPVDGPLLETVVELVVDRAVVEPELEPVVGSVVDAVVEVVVGNDVEWALPIPGMPVQAVTTAVGTRRARMHIAYLRTFFVLPRNQSERSTQGETDRSGTRSKARKARADDGSADSSWPEWWYRPQFFSAA